MVTLLWLLVAVVLCGFPAQAQHGPNLVVNGGAETGDLTGWQIRSTVEGTYRPPNLRVDYPQFVPNPPNRSGSHRFSVAHAYEFVAFFQYQAISVEPGRLYEAGFSITQWDGTNEFASMYVYDGDVLPGMRPEDTPLQGLETTAAYCLLYSTPYDATTTTWWNYSGARFRPSSNKVTLAIYYRHVWETGLAVWHVDDIYLWAVETQPAPTPTPGGGIAGNLLINPGAEAGSMVGWSWGGDVFPSLEQSIDPPNPYHFSGSHHFTWTSLGENNRKGYMYQVINTIQSHYYGIGFHLSQQDGTDEYLDVYTANSSVNNGWLHRFGAGYGPYRQWTPFSGMFRAEASQTVVIIHFKHIWGTGRATFHVDDLYCIDYGAVPPTPSPTPTITPTPTPTRSPTPTRTRPAAFMDCR